MAETELFVNGQHREVDAEPDTTLLEVLRNDLGLTGAKYGCGEGQCGACTVLVDGRARRSCVTPLSAAAGKAVTTIEGLEKDGRLDRVQQAFLDAEAFQCAYCTSGMILGTVALLRENAHPTRADIERALDGNLCRCGTYPRILDAVERAARAGRRL